MCSNKNEMLPALSISINSRERLIRNICYYYKTYDTITLMVILVYIKEFILNVVSRNLNKHVLYGFRLSTEKTYQTIIFNFKYTYFGFNGFFCCF